MKAFCQLCDAFLDAKITSIQDSTSLKQGSVLSAWQWASFVCTTQSFNQSMLRSPQELNTLFQSVNSTLAPAPLLLFLLLYFFQTLSEYKQPINSTNIHSERETLSCTCIFVTMRPFTVLIFARPIHVKGGAFLSTIGSCSRFVYQLSPGYHNVM